MKSSIPHRWVVTLLIGFVAFVLLAFGPALVRFEDVSTTWGFTVKSTYGGSNSNKYILESTGNGAAIFDFDGDGRNDVLITNGTTLDAKDGDGISLLLYRNTGSGRFEEVAKRSGLTVTGWAQAACVADIDNDGDVDLAVTYFGVNRVFRNIGGSFEDATKALGMPTTGNRWGSGCTWVDYDRDGYVDLYVSNYVNLDLERAPKPGDNDNCMWKGVPVVCGPVGLPKARDVLYRNRGGTSFEDVSAKAGILKSGERYGLAAIAADFNNDGWPDIYVACDQTPSKLYENKGNGTFVERGAEAGVAYNADGRVQAGMGVAVADIDSNGTLDIAKTNFSGDLPSLYVNEDGRFYHDSAKEAGLGAHQLLGWGVAFLDVDEDGLPDLVMANGHVYPEVDRSNIGERYRQLSLLYRNVGGGKFVDMTSSAGEPFRAVRPARGLAVGDLDGDGRPEIVIVNVNETPTVLKNTGPRGNWLRVTLEGTKSNRSAIGARVTLRAGGRSQTAELSGGGSYYSQHEPALYFGLGRAEQAESLSIRWPSGTTQVFRNVPGNRTVNYREQANSVDTKP
jgi:hypothetical protein